VSVYIPAFAGTHGAYPQKDGQAELTWVAGYSRSLPVQTSIAVNKVTHHWLTDMTTKNFTKLKTSQKLLILTSQASYISANMQTVALIVNSRIADHMLIL